MDLDPGSLVASLVVSTIGFGLFVYGKRQQRLAHLVAGLLMMVYPYFVPGVLPMLGIAAALLGALWFVSARGIA